MAHHNLLGICHQLKIRHLYRTFNFSTQCICMGTGSLCVYGFRRFRGKARPLRWKTVFAVASIPHLAGIGPGEWIYCLVVVLVGSCPRDSGPGGQ